MGPKLRIGTHNGNFHCDEVLACSLLKHSPNYEDAEIVRSRNMEILNNCDIVVDVGGMFDPSSHRYDHHQKSFGHSMNSLNPEFPWTIKLSSAGLVYFHFGHQIIANILGLPTDADETKVIYKKIYENFIQEIDALDNGIDPYPTDARFKIKTNLTARVSILNPYWNDPNPDESKCFQNALQLVEKEFLDIVNYYGKVWLPAREIVLAAVQERYDVHPSGEIIELKKRGCPWKEHLYEIEETLKLEKPIKFIIYEDSPNHAWRVQCVSIAFFSFENRISLNEEWKGLKDDELSKISGIDNCIFVHMSAFTGGNKTKEGVIQMAVKSLQK